MIRALYSAASGMTAQQMNVDNIAHNLANANTSGFKARRAQFQDLIYQTVVQPGSASGQQTTVPTGLQVGLGTRTSSNEILFTQGSFAQTDNPLDMVIQGKGFFQIRRASGELAYTRSGAFHLDKDGNMVTQDGNPLEPQITIPSAALQISIGSGRNGQLYAAQSGGGTAGRPDSARHVREPGRAEQHRRQPVYADRFFGRCDRGHARRAGRVWARSCRATPNNPTFPWWKSSST